MKKFYSFLGVLAFLLITLDTSCQAKLTYNGVPKIVMDGGVYLVVENPNTDALHPNSAAAPIILSEDETNIVRWYIGSTTGQSYQLPWSSPGGSSVRQAVFFDNAAAAGVQGADAYIDFATYGTPSTNLPAPTGVNHITTLAVDPPGTSNENNTVDRYWIMDVQNYTTIPTPRLWFALDNSEIAAPNTITTASLMIQRYNEVLDQWADYLPAATSMNASNLVGSTVFPSAEVHRVWTITSFGSPLSVDLLGFDAQCNEERVKIQWSTASETNSDFFSVQKSHDAENWETIEVLSSAGLSSSLIDYEVYDLDPKNGVNYYQLIETDVNGVETKFGPISTSCGSNVFEIVNVINNYGANEELDVVINSSEDKIFDLRIIDITGKLVYENINMSVSQGITNVQIQKGDLGMGIYFITVQTPVELLTKKVVLN